MFQSTQDGPVPDFLKSVERLTSGFSSLSRQSLDKIKDALALRDAENVALVQANFTLKAEIDSLQAEKARFAAERDAALEVARLATAQKERVVEEQRKLLAANDAVMRSFGRGIGVSVDGGSRISAFEEIARARVKYGAAREGSPADPVRDDNAAEPSFAAIPAEPDAIKVRRDEAPRPLAAAEALSIEVPNSRFRAVTPPVSSHGHDLSRSAAFDGESELAASLAEFSSLVPGRRGGRMSTGA